MKNHVHGSYITHLVRHVKEKYKQVEGHQRITPGGHHFVVPQDSVNRQIFASAVLLSSNAKSLLPVAKLENDKNRHHRVNRPRG